MSRKRRYHIQKNKKMAVITKRGIKPEEMVYDITCYVCQTDFVYQGCEIVSRGREGDPFVLCPLCDRYVPHKVSRGERD